MIVGKDTRARSVAEPLLPDKIKLGMYHYLLQSGNFLSLQYQKGFINYYSLFENKNKLLTNKSNTFMSSLGCFFCQHNIKTMEYMFATKIPWF